MRIAPIKKLLSRVLDPDQVEIVIDVWQAERRARNIGRDGSVPFATSPVTASVYQMALR
jgi:hypothetical protein